MSAKYSVGDIVLYENHIDGFRKGNIKRVIPEHSNNKTEYNYYIASEINHPSENLVKEHQIYTNDFISNVLNNNLGL